MAQKSAEERRGVGEKWNGGVEGRHGTWGNRGWRWCCGFENGEWQNINAPTTAHNRKKLTFRVK